MAKYSANLYSRCNWLFVKGHLGLLVFLLSCKIMEALIKNGHGCSTTSPPTPLILKCSLFLDPAGGSNPAGPYHCVIINVWGTSNPYFTLTHHKISIIELKTRDIGARSLKVKNFRYLLIALDMCFLLPIIWHTT